MYPLLLGSFLVGQAWSSSVYEKASHVTQLTSDTFDQALDDYEYVLVFFYAPTAHQTRKLFKEYAKVAASSFVRKNSDKQKRILLAKVDTTVEKQLAERFGVHAESGALQFFVQVGIFLTN